MRLNTSRIAPSIFEVFGLGFLSFVLLFIGDSKQLLSYYGLDRSSQVLKQSTNGVVNHSLTKLDGFSITNRLVIFVIWAVVGIICFSIVQAVGSGLRDLKETRALSSNQYVHPANFQRTSFWRSVIIDFVVMALSLGSLLVLLYLFFVILFPTALNNSRAFMQGISLQKLGDFLLGAVIIYAWLLVFDTGLRLVANRHRLTV